MGLNWIDLAYGLGIAVSAPVWGLRRSAREKVLSAFRERMGVGLEGIRADEAGGTTVMVHAVALGEINATRTLVGALLEEGGGGERGLRVVVSVTTTTGYARAKELYGGNPRVRVVRYPLDFSWAVGRVLDACRPDVVVLMELELWPNFVRSCRKRGVPVMLVNGRLTEHSRRRYGWIGPVAKRMLRSLEVVCVQDEVYRERFVSLGAVAEKVVVTGTMKFDTAQLLVAPEVVGKLAGAVGIGEGDRVLVAGSTGPGEEEILLRVYAEMVGKYAGLKMVLVPRKPERFEEVAGLIRGSGFAMVRRSSGERVEGNGGGGGKGCVVLGDTMGELRAFYALGEVVVVGRSLVDLGPKQHGSDMLEPAALGKPVVVGKWTGNFADAMHLLRRNGAVVEVGGEGELREALGRLLGSEEERKRVGEAGRRTVEEGKGATRRHVERVMGVLGGAQAR